MAGNEPVRAVILDRDGVINEDSEAFIKSVAEWHPIPGSLDALARLHHAGYALVVVSNQSGIARGLLSQADLEAIHARLRSELAARGAALAGIWFCPHGPDEGCDCRKPRPGLLLAAAKALAFRLADTWVIGDSMRDLEAAEAAGAKPVLVLTGNGRRTERQLGADASVPVYDDLAHAVAARLSAD